jgi:DNA-binding NarL/FixJ family response regulator
MTAGAGLAVLVVDDHAVVRTGVRSMLAAEPDIRVVGEAADAVEALALVAATGPDVVLLDLSMPGGDGLAVIEALAAGDVPDPVGAPGPRPRVLVLTSFDDDDLVRRALAGGAHGYLLKGELAEGRLLAALRAVAAGVAAVAPEVLHRLARARISRPDADAVAVVGDLSPRERTVLREVAAGRDDVEIARRLGLSVSTVKTYVHRAMRKVGADSRVQAVVLLLRAGRG